MIHILHCIDWRSSYESLLLSLRYRWAALIVVAGFGYYTVKSNNTAKKREFMIKQGQLQQQRDAASNVEESAATSTPIRAYHLVPWFADRVQRGTDILHSLT